LVFSCPPHGTKHRRAMPTRSRLPPLARRTSPPRRHKRERACPRTAANAPSAAAAAPVSSAPVLTDAAPIKPSRARRRHERIRDRAKSRCVGSRRDGARQERCAA
jgi:hypothetical protein